MMYFYTGLSCGNCSGQDRKTNCHFVGYQPIGARNLQKDQTFKPSVGVTPKDMHLDQTMAGLSANVLQNDSRTVSDFWFAS